MLVCDGFGTSVAAGRVRRRSGGNMSVLGLNVTRKILSLISVTISVAVSFIAHRSGRNMRSQAREWA